MRRLGRTVPAFAFSMLMAVSPANAQSARSLQPPVWAKYCGKATVTSKNADASEEKKIVSLCLTYHEVFSGNGTFIVGAALKEIDGQDKKHLVIIVPPDTQLQPAMRAQLFPRNVWETLQTNGKLDKSEEASIKDLEFGSTFCDARDCAAEIEATPALISELEAAGGLVVFAVNPSGTTVARPVPLVGFAKAFAGRQAEAGTPDRRDRPMVCASAEWRGCSMKPIHEWKR